LRSDSAASGEHLIYRAGVSQPVTRAEIAALLAVAQDHAFGQPPGSQLRSTVVAQHLARAAAVDQMERATTWWVSTLRFLGCTGHAFETAAAFGDEIELRAWSLQADASNPVEFLRMMIDRATQGRAGLTRIPAVVSVLVNGKAAAQENFHMACEVADLFAVHLGMSESVRASLASNFERWNGRGLPDGRRRWAIPRPMRIAQIAQELEVLTRTAGLDRAVEVIQARKGRAYDPDLTDLVVTGAERWIEAATAADPWDAALAGAPRAEPLDDAGARDMLLVLADFADLKSPWTGGHSREVATLAAQVCGPGAEAAAFVHDLGRVAVPNSIWDKPGPLTRDERDRVETHPLVTDQMLRRVPFTAALAGSAAAAHERLDGSGYHRRLGAGQLDETQRVIAVADCYQAMISDRPYRRAIPRDRAAIELRTMAAEGRLDGEAVERVLEAAGHRRRGRTSHPAGLTARECDVLRLLALGCTTRQVADQLFISPKTADRHVQNIYQKIGVSTRGAAALFAIENGILIVDR
jgi:HD-GYP domain-containing protein (c-di-GMP phosphodiesterase class II)